VKGKETFWRRIKTPNGERWGSWLLDWKGLFLWGVVGNGFEIEK
jgi:hypothetical protein